MLRNTVAAVAIILVASCTVAPDKQSSTSAPAARAASASGPSIATPSATPAPCVDASAELSTSAASLAASVSGEAPRAAPIVYKGNDRQVRIPAVEEPVRFLGEDVSLNFEQAPLSEVMHAIMGDILQLDYVVDHPIKGQVTLRTRTPIPRDELLGVLDSLLMANNALMIRGSDGRYLVTGSRSGSKLSPGASNAGNSAAGFSTIIVPLRYISAGNMAEIVATAPVSRVTLTRLARGTMA